MLGRINTLIELGFYKLIQIRKIVVEAIVDFTFGSPVITERQGQFIHYYSSRAEPSHLLHRCFDVGMLPLPFAIDQKTRSSNQKIIAGIDISEGDRDEFSSREFFCSEVQTIIPNVTEQGIDKVRP